MYNLKFYKPYRHVGYSNEGCHQLRRAGENVTELNYAMLVKIIVP